VLQILISIEGTRRSKFANNF